MLTTSFGPIGENKLVCKAAYIQLVPELEQLKLYLT
jgi:hypothetical protein